MCAETRELEPLPQLRLQETLAERRAEVLAAFKSTQMLDAMPDDAARWLAIDEDPRYRTHALAFLLISHANAAGTFEQCSAAAELAGAIARKRRGLDRGDRLAADAEAGALLALCRWASSATEIEAAWASLAVAGRHALEGTGDAALAIALLAERAALLYQRGALRLAATVARRARRQWQALEEPRRAHNARQLLNLSLAEIERDGKGAPAQWDPARFMLDQGWRAGNMMHRGQFEDARRLLAAERGYLACLRSEWGLR